MIFCNHSMIWEVRCWPWTNFHSCGKAEWTNSPNSDRAGWYKHCTRQKDEVNFHRIYWDVFFPRPREQLKNRDFRGRDTIQSNTAVLQTKAVYKITEKSAYFCSGKRTTDFLRHVPTVHFCTIQDETVWKQIHYLTTFFTPSEVQTLSHISPWRTH